MNNETWSLQKYVQYYFRRFVQIIAPLFFQKKYVVGRGFHKGGVGWEWVWKSIWSQKVMRKNSHIPWPVHSNFVVTTPKNVIFHPNDVANFQSSGCYFQCGNAKIILGKGTYIAPNVGIITANHDPKNLNRHTEAKSVKIGEKCWIGMNSVILPGTTLGNKVVVGAGAIVTKSFEHGNCIIAGNPAKIIKYLED